MLQSLEEGEGDAELASASHVQQLLGKLPAEYVANYARFCRATRPGASYNLIDFANWLEEEAECQAVATHTRDLHKGPKDVWKPQHSTYPRSQNAIATILHEANLTLTQTQSPLQNESNSPHRRPCPFYDHHLSVCPDFRRLTIDAVRKWIKDNGRCWRCARKH